MNPSSFETMQTWYYCQPSEHFNYNFTMIFTPSSTWPMNELVHVHVVSKIRICIIDESSDTLLAKGIRKKAIMIVKTIAKACCFSQSYTWTKDKACQGNLKNNNFEWWNLSWRKWWKIFLQIIYMFYFLLNSWTIFMLRANMSIYTQAH